MNFFSKYRKHLGLRNTTEVSSIQNRAAFNRLRHQYVRFCASPIISHEIAGREFDELCALDSIVRITFTQEIEDPILVIQTKGVILRNPDTGSFHDIGEMMLLMRRKPEASMCFYNHTRLVEKENSFNSPFHHPHVPKGGIICSSYRDVIMQELAGGKVLSAIKMAILAINSYGPNMPFCDIRHWPVI